MKHLYFRGLHRPVPPRLTRPLPPLLRRLLPLFSLLLISLSFTATAQTVTFKGIEYTISGSEASVTGHSSGITEANILEYIFYDGTDYPVTSIGEEAFYGCNGLTSVTIPESVTSIGKWAFYRCNGLTSVKIGNSVTYIGGYAFYECSGLTSVKIGNSVTYIGGYAFYECSGLTSVKIGNSVTSIGNCAFCRCYRLTSVTIPDSVTSIGDGAFSYCGGLMEIIVSESNPNYCSVEGILFDRSKASLICFPAGNQGEYTIPNSVTSIGGRAFSACSRLTSVTIGNSVTSIGYSAFDGCTGLTSVTIPDSVTSIGGYAFCRCSRLTFVKIGNSVTSIGEEAFIHCTGLMGIIVSKSNPNYCSVEGVLFDRSKATLICVPAGKEGEYTIPNSVTSIGDSAFFRCSGLTSVTIGNSVTSIGRWAFFGCDGLTSVTIPDSVTSIGDYAFYCCDGLTSVTIGNSVTSIGYSAFSGCSGLTSVIIGNSVTSLGNNAFSNCSKLNKLESYAYNIKGINGCGLKNNLPCVLKSEEYFEGISSTNLTYFDNLTAVKDGTGYGVVTCDGPLSFSGCRYSEGNIYLVPLAGSVVKETSNVKEVLFNGEDITARVLSEEGYAFTPSPLHARNIFSVQFILASVNGDGKVTGGGNMLSIGKCAGGILVRGGENVTLLIFTADGRMVKSVIPASDEEIIPLAGGAYIIQAGDVIRKVII